MLRIHLRCFLALIAIFVITGCGAYQPTKNVWKGTKSLWYTYVSPPATVDYEDKGELPKEEAALAIAMKGVDTQLARLERVMQNADKPPTQQWLDNLFENFPWLDGFAGVKYDGTILGQQPADSLKNLDFIPLLYEDKKQNSRALRADIQPNPMGPEILLAAPLYDGVDFLGIVVAYFEMRNLMSYSENPNAIVILSPDALLWPGKYDYAATPLSSVNWKEVVTKSVAGTCSNVNGTFFYMIRYLANQPLIFAIPVKGEFPDGNGDLAQGMAFFPSEREKLPPPPMPERKPKSAGSIEAFGQSAEENLPGEPAPAEERQEQAPEQKPEQPTRHGRSADSNEIQPGSRESMLLRKGSGAQGRGIQEKTLEGENVEVERVERPRVRRQRLPEEMPVEMEPAPSPQETPIKRPSPFGPEEAAPEEKPFRPPSPFGPAAEETPRARDTAHRAPAKEETPASSAPESDAKSETSSEAKSPATEKAPASETEIPTLPDGRPSPFGPGN